MYQRIRKPIVIATAVLFHLLLIFHLLFSPVIIVVASYKGIVNASFIVFILLFFLSLFFGRAYCSWFCPGCGIQEILGFFVKSRSKNTKANLIKYFIFAAWLCAIIVGYIINGFKEVNLNYGMTDIGTERKIILTIGAILIIVPISAIFGKFASCKYLCWQAQFMIIGTKIRDHFHRRGLRLKDNVENCKACNLCTLKCPMDIDVMESVKTGELEHPECILCGNCADSCKNKVIRYTTQRRNICQTPHN